jgi:fucose 4-O-acetylase-like acetyltransferase
MPTAALATVHPSPPATAAAPPTRDPWFDNAKMLLVTLVVVGHSWTLLPDTTVNDRLYDFLYLWHMPAFVLVTGYLSRRFTWSRRNLRRLVTGVVVPFLVFEGLLVLFRSSITGADYDRVWLQPHWPMWFLVALVAWRLATPLLNRSRHALLAAVALCLLGGFVQTEILDFNRVLGFLPFFVAGLMVPDDVVAWLREGRARLLAVPVLLAGTVAAWVVDTRLGTGWLYWRDSYADLGVSALDGMLARLVLLGVCLALAAAAIALVPRRDGWFARMGAASLVVYLLHGFFVKGAEYAGLPGWAAAHPALSLPLVTAAAVGLALALASPPVVRRVTHVVDPVRTVARVRDTVRS